MLQSEYEPAWSQGSSGLFVSYSIVAVSTLAGMMRARAALIRLLLSPLYAVVLSLLSGLVVAIETALLDHPRPTVMLWGFVLATYAAVGYVGGYIFARRSGYGPAYRRGAVVSGEPVAQRRKRAHFWRKAAAGSPDPMKPITLAGCAIKTEDETKHFKLLGTTGTGKSTAIREILGAALARGDRAVIADPDGGYLGNFYDAGRGDSILNPFEPDSVRWNLFGEIASDPDVDQLARSLIPDSRDDRTWSEYARTFFGAIVQQARSVGVVDDGEAYRLVAKAPLKELKTLLGNTAAGPFLAEGNERMFGSVRSVTSSALRALGYITRQPGTPFSVRAWVRQGGARHAGGRGGALFLPYRAGEIAALRSMIAAWLRLAIFEAMDCPEGDQRLWFVVDELDALGEIDGLKDALARLRKFGGRSVLGFQSISQVSGIYGKASADTIVENCGNTLILRCSASEQGGTSQFASRLIGQREVVHTMHSRTRQTYAWFPSTTTSEHLNVEAAVMASEIERLPDLEGFLKMASIPDWWRVRLTPVQYPKITRPARSPVPLQQPAAAQPPPKSAIPATTPAPVVPAAPTNTKAKPPAPPKRKTRTSAYSSGGTCR